MQINERKDLILKRNKSMNNLQTNLRWLNTDWLEICTILVTENRWAWQAVFTCL